MHCVSTLHCILPQTTCLTYVWAKLRIPVTRCLLWPQMNEFFQKELVEQRQKQPQTPGWQRETNSSTIAPGDAKCVAAFLRLLAQVSHLQTTVEGETKRKVHGCWDV